MFEDISLKSCVLFSCGDSTVRDANGPEETHTQKERERERERERRRRQIALSRSVMQEVRLTASRTAPRSQQTVRHQNTIRKQQSYCTGTRKQLAIPIPLSEQPTNLPIARDGGRKTHVRQACTTRVHQACTIQGRPTPPPSHHGVTGDVGRKSLFDHSLNVVVAQSIMLLFSALSCVRVALSN